MLSVIMLSAIMLSVIVVSVVVPFGADCCPLMVLIITMRSVVFHYHLLYILTEIVIMMYKCKMLIAYNYLWNKIDISMNITW